MTAAQLAPAIIVPLVAWRLYARVRRMIGRQRFDARKVKIRAGIFGVIIAACAAFDVLHPPVLLGLAGGVAAGALLGWWGVSLTAFQRTEEGDFYEPNALLGGALVLLLIGRFAYRFVMIYQMAQSGVVAPPAMASPLTMVTVGLLFGYYVGYDIALLRMEKRWVVAPPAGQPR